MGLIDKLWDDTFAGPRPDYGLDKLRKHSTSSLRSSTNSKEMESGDDDPRVTKINGGSPSSSPAGSARPLSPFSECTRRQVGRVQGDQVLLIVCEM